jgi:hypothetical protein
MNKSLFVVIFLISISFYGQEKANFYGGFESNSQLHLSVPGFEIPIEQKEIPLRSNNYLTLNYKYKNWTAGILAESYQKEALLNFNSGYTGTNIATFFAQYKNAKIDLTAGYFYEQFGSGLLFRGWEDRALGINNALRGGRIIFKPTNYITLKSIYGKQRTGFDIVNSTIFGTDLELTLSEIFKMQTSEISLGFTYIGRDETTDIVNPNFNNLTNGFGTRLNFTHNSFYASSEFDLKSKDAIVQIQNQINNNFIKPGNALLLNLGYSKKGFGIDGTFRRIENISFFSERGAKGNSFNDKIMNFIPSLTKQHHYNLANIYAYQSQPNVRLFDETIVKAGEIGGQIDVFYEFKKGSLLGGKSGTKVAFNFSNWNALGGTFNITNPKDYKTDFIGFGKKYFSDYNLEIEKKWNKKWHSSFTYINQFYNKKLIEETYSEVNINIIGAETTYKFGTSKSIRVLGEHLWADADKKNWVASTIEFNANSKISFYVSDLYNYGNDEAFLRNHYYNLGGSYRKNSTRIALNYGRQRGGLVCVGGVCRNVPESSGVSLSLNTTF